MQVFFLKPLLSHSLSLSHVHTFSLSPSVWLENTLYFGDNWLEYDDVYSKTGHTDCNLRVFLSALTYCHPREMHNTVSCISEMRSLNYFFRFNLLKKSTANVPSPPFRMATFKKTADYSFRTNWDEKMCAFILS